MMFTDRQKLEREFMRDLTRIGDMLDSSKIKYFVMGSYSLSARGIETNSNENFIVVKENCKEKVIRKLIKLNLFPTNIKEDEIEVHREFKYGEYDIKIIFYEDKIKRKGREIILLEDSFDNERVEVPSPKYGRIYGYFRVCKLEEAYLFFLGEREIIKSIVSSGKLNFDRVIELLKINSLL